MPSCPSPPPSPPHFHPHHPPGIITTSTALAFSTSVPAQVRELDAEHGISTGISSSLRATAASAYATARGTAHSLAEKAPAPSLTPLKHGAGVAVEKGRGTPYPTLTV